jgi:predicted Rossmann fold flavoprotein
MLLEACRRHGVELRLNCETTAVERDGGGYTVTTGEGALRAESLVVATGGLSIPSLGGSAFGYRLAEQFGLRLLPTAPGLVPFTFTGAEHELFARLSGVGCEVELSCDTARFREDLLFTHRGLSGPAVLQLSSYWRPGGPIRVDLLPGQDAGALLRDWKRERPRALLRSQLGPLLPGQLPRELERLFWPDAAERPLADWPDRDLAAVAAQLQGWELKPAATEGYRTAEVTLGGVDTRDLSSRTMESTVPGLFFVGEVVDVTGHLGGFNFQWAWSSGHAAGLAV